MMKRFWTLAVWALVCGSAWAQDVVLTDSALVPPFEGTIGYRIKYEGKVPPEMVPYLPDSMTANVGRNSMRYTYHGGHASELQSILIWDGASQEFLILDPKHATAESRWEYWKSLVAKPAKMPKETLMVAGHKTSVVTLTTEKKLENNKIEKSVDKLWVNDSIWFGGTLVDSLKPQQPAPLAAGIRQIPLQARRGHAGEVVTVITAVTITPGPQNEWLFKAPENYTIKEFDPYRPWHPILNRKN